MNRFLFFFYNKKPPELKLYLKEHFISIVQYRQKIVAHDNQIAHASEEYQLAFENNIRWYGEFVDGKIDRTELYATLDYANELRIFLEDVVV